MLRDLSHKRKMDVARLTADDSVAVDANGDELAAAVVREALTVGAL